jgi:anti-sigma factor RsiW
MNLSHAQEITSYSCETTRAEFSAYLDGAVSGLAMAGIARHLEACEPCAAEFAELRAVQRVVSELGTAQPPANFQQKLRVAIETERERGAHLSLTGKFGLAWTKWLSSATYRFAGAVAAALVLAAGLGWMFAAPISVQANDDSLSHLVAPRYLYSEVPPQPIVLGREVPILVDAQVDTQGRVYDYAIVVGPQDADVRLRVEENLLASVFKPATVFGVPVRGHVVLTYTGVSVRG